MSFRLCMASIALLVAVAVSFCAGDESANFFLKTGPKSVPHIGRRSDFFLKTAKSVPRIGRRSDFFLKTAKSVPRIGRRTDSAPVAEPQEGSGWPLLSGDVIPTPVTASRRSDPDLYYIRKDGQAVLWSDVARDVEENPDLWPWGDMDRSSR